MDWAAFGFWAVVVGAVARAAPLLRHLAAAGRVLEFNTAATGIVFVSFRVTTVVAVRRLPLTDSRTARNSLWMVGTCGMLLASMLMGLR